jgi:alkanesulfonate monooxygenase SsuD/methylene tetrahydromethanopterin reductase-like flavin-dependent oxidoreductase (luciferase family)
LRAGIAAPNFSTPERLVGLAVAAEAHGWDGFFLWDHVHREGTPPPLVSDAWTTLAAIAMVTERIRIGTWVTPIPRRRPQVLARQVTTVDHLSGGRAVLGVGLGSRGSGRALGELRRFGEDPDPRRRAVLLDEGLAAVVGLWSGEPFSLEGSLVHVEEATFLPRPLQSPRVPVWVACEWPHRRPLDRAARYDGVAPIRIVDGVHGFMTPDDVRELVAEIASRRPPQLAGAPFDVAVMTGPPPRPAPAELEEAGATWLLAGSDGEPGWEDDVAGMIAAGPEATLS